MFVKLFTFFIRVIILVLIFFPPGKIVYSIVSDERQMMTEIMYNGPIQTRITLYDDFLFYKSGKPI